ncbi:MAG: ABC transporter ATP-binding protein [Desulfomonilaceae bacterium]
MEDNHLLVVQNLHKAFGRLMPVVDLSFEVKAGEILGIIGPNGAGKTTLFNLISGQIKPDKGTIFFNRADVTAVPAYKKCRLGIARTYQIPRPLLNMSVLENLLVGAAYGAGMGSSLCIRTCQDILELTGLMAKKNVLTTFLPLLDRKRLELARALATKPSLILVDEIAGGLGESEVEEILGIMHSLRKNGMTILWVEHIMMAMQKGPDRLLVLNFGRKLFCGTPLEAFQSKQVQDIYLGAEE